MTSWRRFLLCLLIACLAACQQEAPTDAETASGDTAEAEITPTDAPHARLPDDVTPLHYALDLTIIPDDSHFDGQVAIQVDLKRELDRIWMHGRGIEVEEARLTPEGGESIPASFEEEGKSGVAALNLTRTAAAGKALIEIRYRAPFDVSLAGLYKVEENDRSYAFSQMQAIEARKTLPSFDEPAFKTPFATTITTRSNYHAFTNAREMEEKDLGNGLKRIRYAETPPLPTYLLAFTVGPVDVVEWEPVPATDLREEPIPLRGFAAHGKGKDLAYALENTAALLITLEDYFGIAYPYDKLDIVAAPDFRAGAMENAGLILYRENLLLLDDNASLQQKRSYASVHAHELAHMWFGNLVTMPWWDDIWLNEAFATWMGHKAVDEWQPEYHYDRSMLERSLRAMTNDSLLSARQIREPVEHNERIEEAFDGITYSKGGGVLSMFETWLGEEAFRAGIRNHMRRFEHGNATVFDFIESLAQQAPDKDVDAAFRSFLFQPGVPFVQVSLDCSGEQAQARLSHRRYLPWGTEETEQRRWTVPVCLSYDVDEQVREECVLLDAPEMTVDLGTALTCPDWIMPNRDGAGYYRFDLGSDGMQALATAAEDHLNTREKIAFADSLAVALKNGSLEAAAFLAAVPDLVGATERAVATAPLDPYFTIQDEFLNEANRARSRAYARHVLGQRLVRAGSKDGAESEMEGRLLRARLIETLALEARDTEIRAEMERLGHAFLGWGGDGQLHSDAVQSDLLETALSVAGENADAEFHKHMVDHLRGSDAALTRRALLRGLGRVQDSELLSQSLELAFDEGLRVNEIPTLVMAGLAHHNRDQTWDWFAANLDRLLEVLPERFGNFTPYFASGFCAFERAEALKAMYEPRLEAMPGATRPLAQAVEYITQCAALRERQAASANQFFEELSRERSGP